MEICLSLVHAGKYVHMYDIFKVGKYVHLLSPPSSISRGRD
jgi:hypothetical protein